MNKINKIISILNECDGEASFDVICNKYQDELGVSLSQNHKISILSTLKENSDVVLYNDALKTWKVKNNNKNNISSLRKETININQTLLEDVVNIIKSDIEFTPSDYDGSYVLMDAVINEYSKMGNNIIFDVKDMNFIYSCCVGTWKMKCEIKKDRLNQSSLPDSSKKIISNLIDSIWENAEKKLYYNSINNSDYSKIQFGMFGAPFMVMQKGFSKQDANAFIHMCIDIIKEDDENRIYNRCLKSLTGSYRFYGIQAGVASEILHCLKPFVFPIINTNDRNGTIFEKLGIMLDRPKLLLTYIDNCRSIQHYRDINCKFKNYRVFDVAAWSLGDNSSFNLELYMNDWKQFLLDKALYLKARNYDGGIIKLIDLLKNNGIKYILSSKDPSVYVTIINEYGKFEIYDRKKDKVRIDIPRTHPLSNSYEKIGGYIYNENNEEYINDKIISVYFDLLSFNELINVLRGGM